MTISAQLLSALAMMASGVMVMAMVDGYRSVMSYLPRTQLLRQLARALEFLLWCLLGILTFYLLYVLKGGQWRAVDPLFQLVGIFLYSHLLHPIFRFFGRLFIVLIVRPIVLIFYVIGRIVLFVWAIIRGIVLFFLRPFIFFYRKIIGKRFKKVL